MILTEKEKRDINATRKALLDSAERLMISCSDPSQVTSRAITREAGVNLAMINYCFGSREALLFEVFGRMKARTLENSPVFGEIINGNLSPKEKLIELHFASVKMMIEHYNLTKAIIQYILLTRDISADRGSVAFICAHFAGRRTEAECRLIAFELSSLHELLILRYEDIKNSCGIDLTDDAVLKRIITDNVNKFLDR